MMRGPRRLREDDATTLERALLDAGASYRCSPGTRARTLAALGIAGSATISATTSATTASAGVAEAVSPLAKLGATKLATTLASVALVAALPVGYLAWHWQGRSADGRPDCASNNARTEQVVPIQGVADEPGSPHPSAPSVPALPETAVRASREPSQTAVRASREPSQTAVRTSREPSRARPVSRDGVAVRQAPAALRSELAMLDGARSSLSGGDASGALALLDQYSREYPHGRLELEAEVLRIDALARSGHSDVAQKRADAFLRLHPKSVLASRVRAFLGD